MVIAITGSRKGIGCNLAEHYLEQGHTVIGCSREMSDLKTPGYTHFQVDVSDEQSVNEWVKNIRSEFKSVDVLINNAGVASMNHFMLTPTSTARRLMDINYFGTYYCTRAFVNLLRKSANPRIINFTTVAVPLVQAGDLTYVTAKTAIEALTKVLAKELAQFKITVNAVGPSAVDTDLTSHLGHKRLEALLEKQAINRIGTFADVSNVTDFFISPQSDFVTGQIIYLGGIN